MQGTWVRYLARKIPQAAQQLSPGATTTESTLQGPHTTTTEPLHRTTEANTLEGLCVATDEPA